MIHCGSVPAEPSRGGSGPGRSLRASCWELRTRTGPSASGERQSLRATIHPGQGLQSVSSCFPRSRLDSGSGPPRPSRRSLGWNTSFHHRQRPNSAPEERGRRPVHPPAGPRREGHAHRRARGVSAWSNGLPVHLLRRPGKERSQVLPPNTGRARRVSRAARASSRPKSSRLGR
jgi:hypothetical protein